MNKLNILLALTITTASTSSFGALIRKVTPPISRFARQFSTRDTKLAQYTAIAQNARDMKKQYPGDYYEIHAFRRQTLFDQCETNKFCQFTRERQPHLFPKHVKGKCLCQRDGDFDTTSYILTRTIKE